MGRSKAITITQYKASVVFFRIFNIPIKLAFRDLRGGISSFRIFITCLILGVAAISGVGSISKAMNAGITKDNIFLRMSIEEWTDVIDVNLNSSFYLLKHFIKKMVKKRYGRIVFISSVVAHTGNPGQVNYTASKAAISGMVKSLALELSSRNITVNSVAPGFIESNMTNKLNENQKSTILERIPMKKLGKPLDIAKTVGFLCSDNADYITGQTIHVNGGLALI